MLSAKDFEGLEYDGLIDLLGEVTKEYTGKLASDPKWKIDDEKIYFMNLLIKEIVIREALMVENRKKNDDVNLTPK